MTPSANRIILASGGFFRDAFGFAFQAMAAHKTRTLLTSLSMVIGNAAVIVVVSVALTGRDFVVQQIEGVGANLIYAYYEAGGNVSEAEADYITLDDLDAVKFQLGDLAQGIAGVMGTWDRLFIDGRPRQIRVLGSNEQYRGRAQSRNSGGPVLRRERRRRARQDLPADRTAGAETLRIA